MSDRLFQLVADGTVISIPEGRGDLLKFVDWYYVKRGGYEQVAVNLWALRRDGHIISTVSLVPEKEKQDVSSGRS